MSRQTYFYEQARNTAANLVAAIRRKNQFPVNIKSGRDLRVMPVYENLLDAQRNFSLLEFANEFSPVLVERIPQENTHLDAYYLFFHRPSENGEPISLRRRIAVARHNYCWTRFYVCKELFHCFMFENGEKANADTLTNTDLALEALIQELVIQSGADTNSPQTLVDRAAYVGAWDYIMPDDYLPVLVKAFESHSTTWGAKLAYEYLALRIRVPELLLKAKLDSVMRT